MTVTFFLKKLTVLAQNVTLKKTKKEEKKFLNFLKHPISADQSVGNCQIFREMSPIRKL